MRSRRLLMVAPAAALLAALVAPLAALAVDPATPAFGGPLDGAQEVPPVVTAATGEGTVVISADGTTIWYVVEYSGLSGPAVAAHIHRGAAGVAAGVILPLVVSASPMIGTLTAANFTPNGPITTFAQAVDALKTGGAYFNIHTAANPGGEIRGQVVAKGSALFASLSGGQEVPAVSGSATGDGWVLTSTGGSTLTYYVAYSGLSGALAAAHIHLGAAGVNGGVLLPLAAGASPMTGTLDAGDLTPTGGVTDMAGAVGAIAAGNTYFNLHTAANPGGELRGQVGGLPPVPPPNTATSPATGRGSTDALGLGLLVVFSLAFAAALGRPSAPSYQRLTRR